MAISGGTDSSGSGGFLRGLANGPTTTLVVGFLAGFSIFVLFPPAGVERSWEQQRAEKACPPAPEPIISFKDWQVVQESTQHAPPIPNPEPQQQQQQQSNKVIRNRFVATELGIRSRLVVLVLADSALAVALNASIAHHVPRLHVFADAQRVDSELALLAPNLTPFKSTSTGGRASHLHILQAIANLSLHEQFDWFVVVRDSSYVNPFALLRLIDDLNWNRPLLLGSPAPTDGDETGGARCRLDAGFLISNAAMQTLIQQRHVCNGVVGSTEARAFELCILHATNLSCQSEEGAVARWQSWPASADNLGAHEALSTWAQSETFNRSTAVSGILSEADIRALHAHFVAVESARLEEEVRRLEEEVEKWHDDAPLKASWPPGVPPPARAPNRYQVPEWEFFTSKDIFRNDGLENSRPLVGKDSDDVQQIVAVARKQVETGDATEVDDQVALTAAQFVHLQSGYRLFDPTRGMDYIVDLVYRHPVQATKTLVKRVRVTRPIVNTQLLGSVPYVKEDTDATFVIPVGGVADEEARAAMAFLDRYAELCAAAGEETRKTRIVVVVVVRQLAPGLEAILATQLDALEQKCKRTALETALLKIGAKKEEQQQQQQQQQEEKEEEVPLPPQPAVLETMATAMTRGQLGAAALDEAIDRYGQASIFVLLPVWADIQRDFLDRVRINTIKHFQVFAPIPFMEFHPGVAGMDEPEKPTGAPGQQEVDESPEAATARRARTLRNLREGVVPARVRPLQVHKDQGRFDATDFSTLALYGSDYVAARGRLQPGALDLAALFLRDPKIHVMRAVEPALRLRYHAKTCEPELAEAEYARCEQSRRHNFASKSQLASLLFHDDV